MTVREEVEATYAATHERLANDPEYQRLKEVAEKEERCAPRQYFARNRLAFYVELQMPPISTSNRGFRG